MNRKLVLALTLTLLVGTLNVAFNVQRANASGTIYIRADGSIDPPIVITSIDNVTYTFTDSISGLIVVERDNIIVDGAGYTVQGTGSGIGISLSGTSNVKIKNMKITAFDIGIWLNSSSNNSVSGSSITANNWEGIRLDYSSNNNSVSGNTIANSEYGLYLSSSSNNTIAGNNITANSWHGLWLDSSSSNSIAGNNIANNEYGVALVISSSGNTVSGNNITANTYTGVRLSSSSGNTVSGNNITANSEYGLWLSSSSNYNSIAGNNITANNENGIRLDYSSNNNSVSGNSIANNEYGVALVFSLNNTIFHNNFINNAIQASLSESYNNTWDDGYPSGGNYWSDYNGVDSYTGPFQNVTGGDGIGDTPYTIDANNQDRYPLMNPWTPPVSAPPSVQVGVKAGDWIKCTYTISGWPSGTSHPEWLKVEFLGVEGTNATIRVTMHMSDGTEPNQTMAVDVVAGRGTFQGLSGFVIPANCTTGDSIYMSGYGNVTIAGETTGSYGGASRTVIYASFSQYGTQLTYHWDKLTGVMVEASVVSGGVTGTGRATETNMWQATPSGLPIEPIYLYILAVLAIIIAVGAAAFIIRRKKKPPEEANSPQV